ncbi:hypothetical protein FRC07_000218 [Ceratobasidium sp. 392]|nr:hypothetical protein FRC07_000218 [Ceratobasidium sp. 392]
MVRVNPHFSHVKPNCTYDNSDSWDEADKLSDENLRKLEARVAELEGLLESAKPEGQSPATQSPSSSRSPPAFQSFPVPDFVFDECEHASPSYDLPLVTDEWPASLPPKQLVFHLVDLFFSCWPNARRILHRPSFMSSLLETPSSPRFPYVGLLHAICATGAIHSPFVAVTPLPTITTNRPIEEMFLLRTRLLASRELAFDEEQFLLSKYRFIDSADAGEHLLEVIQGCVIASWWAFSCGRWNDVWAVSTLSLRLCVVLGLNFNDTMHQPIPSDIRNKLWIGPPQSHVEVELRRNVFWLAYATHRIFLAPSHFAYDLSDEDIHQTLPGTLEAFEAGVDDGQERQSALSEDLFTTHRDNLDDFGLYIKCSIMLSRIHVLEYRRFRNYNTEQDIRDSQEMEVMEAVISSLKTSTIKGRFNPTEQPSSTAISNLYMAHILPHFATILCHMLIANWSDPSCESANKSLAAARAILRYTTGLTSTSWDPARVDKTATLCWYLAGKSLLLALQHAPDSLAPILRAEIRLLSSAIRAEIQQNASRKTFLIGNGRILAFARQRFVFDLEIVDHLGEKEAAILFKDDVV